MSGPQVERLRSGIAGANRQLIDTAHQEWAGGSALLTSVASSLENAAPHIEGQIGESGRAAANAFKAVSARVAHRADQMMAASTALARASEALRKAEEARDHIDSNPVVDPGPRPMPPPGMEIDHDHINAMRAWSARSSAAESTASDHETRARIAADHMDSTYTDCSAILREVHGVPDDGPSVPGPGGAGGSAAGAPPSGGGGSATTTPGGGRAPTTAPPATSHPPHPDPPVAWNPSDPTQSTGDDPSHDAGTSTTVDPWLTPGSEQGGAPTAPSTIGTVPGGGSMPSGPPGGPGAPAGIVGALGGKITGGRTGIAGAVRGPSVAPPGAAGTPGRAIGSTSRAGGATGSALGGGAGAATVGSPTGTRGSGRGAAAGGARSAGGGTRAPGTAGSRGAAAGGRGSVAGVPGGRNTKKPQEKGAGLFDEEQDWIDDEGAAPGVID